MNGIVENSINFQETIKTLQSKINAEKIKTNELIKVNEPKEIEHCPFCGSELFDYSIIRKIRIEIGFKCGLAIERVPGSGFITTSLCSEKQAEINKYVNQFRYRFRNDFD